MKQNFYLLLLILLAFGLRVYRVGVPVFKEDEFTTQKAAAYINLCQANCFDVVTSFKGRLISLITNNETRPNLFATIHPWNFIIDQAEARFDNRAWPQIYLIALTQKIFGFSGLSLRLVSVIAGSLIIPVGFIFARHFSGSASTGLVYGFLLAIAFPLIDYSRHARMYAPFITCFLLAAYLWHRLLTAKKPGFWLIILTILISFLSYWLHSLTLLLFIGIYIFSFFKFRRWFLGLSGLLIIYTLVGELVGVDFFRRQFLGFAWPPHWQYFSWFYLIGLGLLWRLRQQYLFTISITYLLIVTFLTNWRYGSAYAIALWPIMLFPFLTWSRWLKVLAIVSVSAGLILKINYLYFGRDGRAVIPQAYEVIKKNFNSGDKIYAVMLRDYYLADLPPDTEVIDLQKTPEAEFSGTGYVVWEEEKTGHLNPVIREYVQSNFTYLGSHGVEIYSFGK